MRLSVNPNAIEIFKTYPQKQIYNNLASNPGCVDIISEKMENKVFKDIINDENNPTSRVFWAYLSLNPGAIHLLSKLDHEKMKASIKDFSQELIQYVFNPERCKRISKNHNVSLVDYLEILKS